MSEQWKMNDEESQMPLGVGGDNGDSPDLTFASDSKSKINTTILLIVAVFAAGIGMIYVLGLQNRPQKAAAQSAVEVQADSAIAELLAKSGHADQIKKLFKDTDQLIQMFYNYPGEAVANAELRGNPFEHLDNAKPSENVEVLKVLSNANPADQDRLRKAADSFAALKLQTVIMGKTMKAAMINQKLVTVGAKVGEFVVEEIEPHRVILKSGTDRFELKLNRPIADGQ